MKKESATKAIRVDSAIHHEIRVAAPILRMDMGDLVAAAWAEFKEAHWRELRVNFEAQGRKQVGRGG